jgi:hypothetical protein
MRSGLGPGPILHRHEAYVGAGGMRFSVRTLASYGACHIGLAAMILADIGTRWWSLDRDCQTRRGMMGNVLDSSCYLLSPGDERTGRKPS